MLGIVLSGVSMALADSVPGVSGGTIAYILGFYETFIEAIYGLFGRNSEKRKTSFIYLCKFGCGWVIGMSSAILVLSNVFKTNVYFMSSMFMGFIIAAIPFIIRDEMKVIKNNYRMILLSVLGIGIVVFLSLFRTTIGGAAYMDFTNLGLLEAGYILVCGFCAILAMLLPGISGSTLLLIFGIYMPVITTLKEIMHFDFSGILAVVMLITGVLIGGILGARLIRRIFKNHRAQIVYIILGLMIGSLYSVYLGPTTINASMEPLNINLFNGWGFIIGVAVIGIMEVVRKKFGEGNK